MDGVWSGIFPVHTVDPVATSSTSVVPIPSLVLKLVTLRGKVKSCQAWLIAGKCNTVIKAWQSCSGLT